MSDRLYHIGFGSSDLAAGTTIALLSGDPDRSELIATEHLADCAVLSRNRGLDAFAARLPGGLPVVCATSGMGAPSMSIVVNELVQAGIRTIIRIGTSGSIQDRRPRRLDRHRVRRPHQPGRRPRRRRRASSRRRPTRASR